MTTCWLQWEQRPGETIYKGHRSYDLMLNLQLGIRWSISRNARDPALKELPTSVFSEKAKLVSLSHGKAFEFSDDSISSSDAKHA